MAPKKGRGDQPFVPVSKDKQREAKLKFYGFKWVTKGQTMPNSNGNFLMECKLCGQGFRMAVGRDGRDGSLGKREDTIIRARAVVRFIREHGAALSLYRRFSAAHPSSASAAAGGSSSAPPSSQRRGRELVYPVQTRFATHYLMLERLLDRRRALEALMMSDDWLRTAWRRSIFLQARWVCHQVRYAPFWEHVKDIVALMTPVMQLLRRLDRGRRVMTRMWSWGFVMVNRVARASLNRMLNDELHIVVQACQGRVAHMLEPAHWMAHLLNPRQRSITFFGAARRTDHERILADESLRYLRQQTGGDEDLYQTLRTQLAEFHSREGDWTYGGAEGDRDAAACKGEKETSQVKRRNQLGFIKLTRLVEISTNLRLSRCQRRGSGYVLPWEDTEEETEEAIPPPRDEGARPADRVTEAQRDRQVQRGRKDRLSKAPLSVATYFGRRATVLMAHELESVYDPEPDPMAQDAMEAEPWSDPDDLAMELEPGGSNDDDDDAPLIQILRPRDRCSGAGRGGSGPGVGGARRTGGAGRAGTGKVRRESASSTRTVHWVDEERPAEAAVVAPSPMEVAPSPAEFAVASAEGATASAEGPGGFAGGSGNAGEVGRPFAQVGVSYSDNIFYVSLGHPPTPAGERVGVDVDAAATPVSQILRDIPSCSTGDISSSMLQEAAERAPGRSGQHDRAAGDDGECRPMQERATE
ncbi:hypothetical protein CBR_g32142 [Chara braunii]|uniref:BED-type domain-containing protein n=1 Tax=Chara braunii TaxID=69332 RepID=A0A388JMY7_CHABU|nr:hypothetical protein CBR_g32142 [Chara braunii]|eukprot:GBG59125.1 hypothetical protein CBR_g32142 [Chara braunii]